MNSDECNVILDKIAAKLHDANAKPRSILNTLSLVEFLLKNGSTRFKIEVEEDQFFIKKLRNYHDEEDEEDLARSIQTLAQRIIALLENKEELTAAREEAKKLRSRIQGFSSEAEAEMPQSSDPKYQGFSSDSYQNEKFSSASGSSLAKKLGLEPPAEPVPVRREEREETPKKPEPPQVVDLLEFDSKPTPKNTDLLSEGVGGGDVPAQVKAKFGSKLLPPPPGKGSLKAASNVSVAGSATPHQIDSPLDLDFNSLNFTGAAQQQTAAHPPQYSTILTGVPKTPDDGNLLGLDVAMSAPTLPTKSVSDSNKKDFDFDFGGSLAHTQPPKPSAAASDFDLLGFGGASQPAHPSAPTNGLPEQKPKAFGKLPVPPKKGTSGLPADSHSQSHSKDASDFLF